MNFITSKHAVGDKVYFLENNYPRVGQITEVFVQQQKESTYISYHVDSSSERLYEDELFGNGSLLLNGLCKRLRLLEEASREEPQAMESDEAE